MGYSSSTDSVGSPGFTWTNDLNTGMYQAGDGRVGIASNGTEVAVFESTGTNQGMYTQYDVTVLSDARVKTDLTPIGDAVEKVLALTGYTYRRKDHADKERWHMGLVAQEVEAVAPEAVNDTAAGLKAVNYGNMVALLVEAVKGLERRVAALEAAK